MYLFDTSSVIDWLQSTRLSKIVDDSVSMSVLSLTELIPAARRKGKDKEEALNLFMTEASILPVTEDIARLASEVVYSLRKAGKEKAIFDILIASTASLENMTLITLDHDFEIIGSQMKLNYKIIPHL